MRSFSGATLASAYIGVPLSAPIQLCAAPGKSNTGVVVTLNWATYWLANNQATTIGVPINLKGNNVAGAQLDRIMSVFIDNLDSSIPVYVAFADTGFVVAAPANSANWYPVMTQNLGAVVYAVGLATGSLPTTRVTFANVFVPPYSDAEISQAVSLWRASPAISRGVSIYNARFGTPALGDQTAQYTTPLTSPLANTALWGTPKASGFIYLTNINMLPLNPSATLQRNCSLTIKSLGASGILFDVPFAVYSSFANLPTYSPLLNFNGMNIQLDATESWVFTFTDALNGINSGVGSLITNWTYQP